MTGRLGTRGSRGRSRRRADAQRGFGGFFMMFLLAALAASTALFTFARTDTYRVENDRQTLEALASVKAALIGYALKRGGPTGTARPGELPCPDTDPPDPTNAGYGFENAPCNTTASLFGRVPWKTLGIPEPRDGSGEVLWYAISPSFRDTTSNPGSGASDRINSDSRGTIVVRGADGTTLTDNAVAVVIAPGASIGQNRGLIGTLTCTLTSLLVSASQCANNYFESITVGGVTTNNAASVGGPFIAGALSSTFNDRLTYITTSEFIPLVEMRVGRELIAALQAYYAAYNYFPYTDNWPYSGGIADTGQSRGRYPSDPNPSYPSLPDWVAANDWQNFFWYTVSRGYTKPSDGTCKTCSANPVTLDGVTVKALIISPGTPLDNLARVSSTSRRDNINLYFEDAANRDGADSSICPDVGEIGDAAAPSGNFQGQPACDIYVTPTSTAFDRDRVYIVP